MRSPPVAGPRTETFIGEAVSPPGEFLAEVPLDGKRAASKTELTREFMLAAGRTTTLYDMSAAYSELLVRIEDGEYDDDTAADIEAIIDAIGGAIETKAEAIVSLATDLEYRAAAGRAEAKRLTDRAIARERKAERLQQYLLRAMQAAGIPRIETVRFTLAVRQNPGRVEVLEQAMVPRDFIKTVVTETVDKRAISAHIKESGEVPDGVELVKSSRLEVR
jgi:hypothetical protein